MESNRTGPHKEVYTCYAGILKSKIEQHMVYMVRDKPSDIWNGNTQHRKAVGTAGSLDPRGMLPCNDVDMFGNRAHKPSGMCHDPVRKQRHHLA
jgi:hypothetical protein